MLRLTMKQLQWMKGGRWLVVGSRPSRAGGYPLSIKSVPATAQGQQSDSCEERVGLPGLQSNLLRCFSSHGVPPLSWSPPGTGTESPGAM